MSRRRTKTATAVTYDKPWTEGMRELFDLVPRDWTPPATVRVRRSSRGMTIAAVFRTPAGHPSTARARVVVQADGWVQTLETLASTFTTTMRTAP